MNITLVEESSLRETIKEQWRKRQRYIRHYPNKVIWWDKYVNRRYNRLFNVKVLRRTVTAESWKIITMILYT
jgi:hypothetical protein